MGPSGYSMDESAATVARNALGLRAALGLEAFELDVRVVRVPHGHGDGVVARLLVDQPVHLLHDPPIHRMTLWRGPKLDPVHPLSSVHLHDEPDAVGHAPRVLGGIVEPLREQRLVDLVRAFHDRAPFPGEPGLLDFWWELSAVARGHSLTCQRHK